MADYFSSDHFELLKKWEGQKRDESNPEQNRAYEELKKAYEVTQVWAAAVKATLFPTGTVKIRKRPTSQANKFLPYNWARIYPSPRPRRCLDGPHVGSVPVQEHPNFVQALWRSVCDCWPRHCHPRCAGMQSRCPGTF